MPHDTPDPRHALFEKPSPSEACRLTFFLEHGGDLTQPYTPLIEAPGAPPRTAPLWQWLLNSAFERSYETLLPHMSRLVVTQPDQQRWDALVACGRTHSLLKEKGEATHKVRRMCEEKAWQTYRTLEGRSLLMLAAEHNPAVLRALLAKRTTSQALVEACDDAGLSLWPYLLIGIAKKQKRADPWLKALEKRLPSRTWSTSSSGEGLFTQTLKHPALLDALLWLKWHTLSDLVLPLFTAEDSAPQALLTQHLLNWHKTSMKLPYSMMVIPNAFSSPVAFDWIFAHKYQAAKENVSRPKKPPLFEVCIQEEIRPLSPSVRALLWFSCVCATAQSFSPCDTTPEEIKKDHPLLLPTTWGLSLTDALRPQTAFFVYMRERWKERRPFFATFGASERVLFWKAFLVGIVDTLHPALESLVIEKELASISPEKKVSSRPRL